MNVLSKNVIYHGCADPLPERVALRAGPVSLYYEDGDLRYLRIGNREIIRRIYAAVRDRNWGTIPAKFRNVDVIGGQDSFRVSYEAEHHQGDVHFTWRADIVGEPSGRIVFTMNGQAQKSFLKNRIGFCVLHPIAECAGAICHVVHADGTTGTTHFPKLIAAEQPVPGFSDMIGLSCRGISGCPIKLMFFGEFFEMEDQRNWIDASYKTYCTPLRLPFPVEVGAGERVQQQVALEISGTTQIRAADPDEAIEIAVDPGASFKLPNLGLSISSLRQPLSETAVGRLRQLNLAHLRADLRLSSPDWKEVVAQAAHEGGALNMPLELALILPSDSSVLWPEVRAVLRQLRPGIARFLVFADGEKTTTSRALGLAKQHLADLRARFGAGTNADFYQLNQERPPCEAADFVTWSMNPQVHAFDVASIAETPEAVRAQIQSAREYFPRKPLVVSPVTLKPRFNPVATGPESPVLPGELPPQVDPRQTSLFGAAWTLAVYKHLAEAELQSVTFYETVGWRGVLETDEGPPLPEKFPSLPQGVFPMYHFFADVGEFSGGEALKCVSSQPLAVEATVLRSQGRACVLLANLTGAQQLVRLPQTLALPKRARLLDAGSADVAMRDPDAFRERWTRAGHDEVALPPFAYCRLDIDEQ